MEQGKLRGKSVGALEKLEAAEHANDQIQTMVETLRAVRL